MKIHTGKRAAPDMMLLYGVEGVGKSTFAAGAPSPVFISAEDGVRHLDVASFSDIDSWPKLIEAVDWLMKEEHGYKTVVLDTIDWIEGFVRDAVQKDMNLTAKDYDAYGRGVGFSLDYWRKLVDKLNALRDRGIGTIAIAHSQVKTFSNPSGEDYMRFEPQMSGQKPSSFWKGKMDTVLFATYQQEIKATGEKRAAKAFATGARIAHTEYSASFDAKNRCGLPPVIELDYAAYAAFKNEAVEAELDIEALRCEVDGLLVSYNGENKAAIVKHIAESSGNAKKLTAAAKRLRELLDEGKSS